MSFICEPHSEMWAVDTGCPYCRERKLEAENAKLEATLDRQEAYYMADRATIAKLKEAAQAVVASAGNWIHEAQHSDDLIKLAAALEADDAT